MKKSLSEKITENSALIEKSMREYLEKNGRSYQQLLESMQYSAYAGGKRIRPFLTLEFCRMLGGDDRAALPYACAIEMIHTYSLIHDDLPCMDNDDLRRGKPTNHKVFGEATALLAGDALLTYAFEVVASNSFATPERNIEAISLLSKNAGFDGMVGGQVLDLSGEKEVLSEDNFLLMNRLKTGCLIKTACLLGCVAAGYSIGCEEYFAAEKYAENIGLAFQIEDDILDFGTEDNKTTFITFMTIKEAKDKVDSLTLKAKNIISKFDESGTLTEFADYLAKRTV